MSSDRDLFPPRPEIFDLIRRAMPRACFGGYTSPVPSLLDAAISSRAAIADYTAPRAAMLDRLSIVLAGGAGELTPARAAALDRLINDLTAARAANLDATISSRMTPAQQNVSAGQAANLDAAVSSRLGSIRSVQTGVVALSTSAGTPASSVVGILSVNTAKSFIIYLGTSTGGSGSTIDRFNGRVELTTATTVTGWGVSAGAANLSIAFMVVEFN